MTMKTVSTADKKPSGKPKSAKKAERTVAIDPATTVDFPIRVDDDLIRERAYDIWIAEGRPHGRDLAHWQRATHELLATQ